MPGSAAIAARLHFASRSLSLSAGMASASSSSFSDKPLSKAPYQQQQHHQPRRFAPLNPERQNESGAPPLKGIVFDVDGTLCLPQTYMFREMRAALNIPKSVDILDHIRSLSTSPDSETPNDHKTPRQRASEAIEAIEQRAMTKQTPQPGLLELMTYLDRRKLPKALCTRNFPLPINHLLETFLPDQMFDPIITRETEGVAPKPSPVGLWKIAEKWGLGKDLSRSIKKTSLREIDPLELAQKNLGAGLIMVGDSVDDMAAGNRAGAATVLLRHQDNKHVTELEHVDIVIDKLDELIEILEEGFVGVAD